MRAQVSKQALGLQNERSTHRETLRLGVLQCPPGALCRRQRTEAHTRPARTHTSVHQALSSLQVGHAVSYAPPIPPTTTPWRSHHGATARQEIASGERRKQDWP